MSARYLDPKNDLVFKRIFGEHANILRSFLNAVLPLPYDALIVELEYLPAEQVPQIPALKNSIVDVRCKDQKGRQFIVEMQVSWTNAFLQRVFFNSSKAYVGVLAQQLQQTSPYMVGSFEKNGEQYLNVDNSAMTYMLINAVKEQQEEIEKLKREIKTIKGRR